MLKNKKIILGVTGSIAAYKAAILLRLLVKEGAEVQVLITPAGKEFITPVTLSALSGKPVESEFFANTDGSWHSHVDMGLWADLMLVAPCSANTMGKMAHGICDNLLLTTYLSAKCPVFVAPAMDLDMYKHIANQKNIDLLRANGCEVIEPTEGELASGLCGKGRMEEPENIVENIKSYFRKSNRFEGKKVLINAGPTYENIDPVRFIGNYSSGKMGYALAEEFATQGATVELVSGPTALSLSNSSISKTDVRSAEEMHEATCSRFENADITILTAAVADFTPVAVADKKIKRGKENYALELKPTKDIAQDLGKTKKGGQLLVGFALENNNEEHHAKAKLAKKDLDLIVLNSLNDAGAGFMHDTNKISIIDKNNNTFNYELKSKTDVAKDIIDKIFESL